MLFFLAEVAITVSYPATGGIARKRKTNHHSLRLESTNDTRGSPAVKVPAFLDNIIVDHYLFLDAKTDETNIIFRSEINPQSKDSGRQ
ncbi:MAG: hypothetical protein V7739_18875 [Motiliproteus sp.]